MWEQAVKKTAATFAPRSSTKSRNPAVPGSTLYTVFEVQGYVSMALGGLLSYNLVFPSSEPDLWRLMGMWSVWMFSMYLSTMSPWLVLLTLFGTTFISLHIYIMNNYSNTFTSMCMHMYIFKGTSHTSCTCTHICTYIIDIDTNTHIIYIPTLNPQNMCIKYTHNVHLHLYTCKFVICMHKHLH